jgi:hypothetical protein
MTSSRACARLWNQGCARNMTMDQWDGSHGSYHDLSQLAGRGFQASILRLSRRTGTLRSPVATRKTGAAIRCVYFA